MIPVMFTAKLLKVLFEQGSHLDDAIGHTLDLAMPLFLQQRILKNFGCDTGTVNRGVGIQRTNENL